MWFEFKNTILIGFWSPIFKEYGLIKLRSPIILIKLNK
jgi:hypothetical protein